MARNIANKIIKNIMRRFFITFIHWSILLNFSSPTFYASTYISIIVGHVIVHRRKIVVLPYPFS